MLCYLFSIPLREFTLLCVDLIYFTLFYCSLLSICVILRYVRFLIQCILLSFTFLSIYLFHFSSFYFTLLYFTLHWLT